MLDVSPLFLWPLEDLLELLPLPTADSPQARRLAVLLAEARAAGTPPQTIFAVLLDWARLLQPFASDSPAALLAILMAAAGRMAAADQPGVGADDLEHARSAAADMDGPVALCAERLAARAQALLEGVDLTPTDAWHDGNDLLAALATLTCDRAEEIIDECAQLAYLRFFPVAHR
jgi:hypothetical protein